MKRMETQLAALALGLGLSLGLAASAQGRMIDPEAARGQYALTLTPMTAPAPAEPEWWDASYNPNVTPQPGDNGLWVVKGRVSIDESEANKDALDRLRQSVRLWLQSQLSVAVDSRWEPPQEMVEGLIRDRYMDTVDAPASVASETPIMKVAGYRVDFSPATRERFLAAYEHEVAVERLWMLGGSILGLLVLLGVFSGYIRADESTKGYFTNRLRAVAFTAGAAGAGAVYYFLLA